MPKRWLVKRRWLVLYIGYHIYKDIPYSGKFSLVQIFAEKHPGSSEEIFTERGTL